MKINLETLRKLAPRALPGYRAALEEHEEVFLEHGLTNVLRVEHFLAQVLHETGALTITTENLNYSPERLLVVWPTRFHTLDDTKPFAHNPRALANQVYGKRMGNFEPDDGWKFVGRGFIQLTGRANYRHIGTKVGVDLVAAPELVLDPRWSLRIACAEWQYLGCNAVADTDNILKVTRAINGGTVGLTNRRVWLSRVRRITEGSAS